MTRHHPIPCKYRTGGCSHPDTLDELGLPMLLDADCTASYAGGVRTRQPCEDYEPAFDPETFSRIFCTENR